MCLKCDHSDLVHCRKRPSKFGHLKHPSTSANVYWQFEKESDRRSGEPLSWGERCRIKHLPTRCYLAVVNNEVCHIYISVISMQFILLLLYFLGNFEEDIWKPI